MSKTTPYIKMHGLGNDFVLIDYKNLHLNNKLAEFAKYITDRRLGIGADQFIIYKKNSTGYEIYIYNPDGSLAGNCGNALRCLAKLIYLDEGTRQIKVVIKDRICECLILGENEISVNMGEANFDADWIPSSNKIWKFAELYMIAPKEIICVGVGNPHLIIFSNLSQQDQEIIGRELQKKEFFPDGVNVNFANIEKDIINLRVFERGTGFTLACGSGACASFAGAKKLGFISSEAEVKFELGSLKMREQNNQIIMTGSASLVARGQYYY